MSVAGSSAPVATLHRVALRKLKIDSASIEREYQGSNLTKQRVAGVQGNDVDRLVLARQEVLNASLCIVDAGAWIAHDVDHDDVARGSA